MRPQRPRRFPWSGRDTPLKWRQPALQKQKTQHLSISNSPISGNKKRYVRDCSKAAMFVNRILGYTIPWPILAGKRYATYFHDASWYFSDATSPFPNIMRKQPSRTRWPSIPHRDIRKPAMRPPIGVAIEGMMSRTPAFDAESRSTTWKNRGIINRNYLPC